METATETARRRVPWNKGKLVGQKAPFKPQQIWAVRIRLQLSGRQRDLALFNLGIDSKLRGRDLVRLQVSDVVHGGDYQVASRAIVMQQKTQRPVTFELTPATREAVGDWVRQAELTSADCLFPSRLHSSEHLSVRQYARVVRGWCREIGLDASAYGTHSMRRTKPIPAACERPQTGSSPIRIVDLSCMHKWHTLSYADRMG